MGPLREWFCKGAAMTCPIEYEAPLRQLEQNPPEISLCNDNIREERWTHFSLERVKFPTATVDVIQRGEALAIFERDLIIHFQQISKEAALYVRALLGGIKRTLEVYHRVPEIVKRSNSIPSSKHLDLRFEPGLTKAQRLPCRPNRSRHDSYLWSPDRTRILERMCHQKVIVIRLEV